MQRFAILFSTLFLVCCAAVAQGESLIVTNVFVRIEVDPFGLERPVVTGMLQNVSDDAYENITIGGEVLSVNDEVIGELFGFAGDACGAALIDLVLQPGEAQPFRASVDLYEDAAIARVDATPSGRAITAVRRLDDPLPPGVTRVTSDEVVSVQWENENTLRYGVGCDRAVFTTYDWSRYTISSGRAEALAVHPNASNVNEAFLRQTGINRITQSGETNPELFGRSFLTFPTQSDRLVFQTDINTLVTTEGDGSIRRVISSRLYQFTLQGFVWSPLGNFAAYYFGSYGEPVRYITASMDRGGRISAGVDENTMSQTVPGVVDDAQRVIISGTFQQPNGQTLSGYFFSSVITQGRELMFEVPADELPGNNYPAPAYWRKDNNTRYVYIVRPINGETTLQCFFREEDELTTLTTLPIDFDPGMRAWSSLSPARNTLAVYANGPHGGLWLVDLNTFDACR